MATKDEEKIKKLQEKEKIMLEHSYEMYEASKADMKATRGTMTDKEGNRIYTDDSVDETLELMETMQDDIVQKYVQLGGDPEDLKKKRVKKINRKDAGKVVSMANVKDEMKKYAMAWGAGDENDAEERPVEVQKPAPRPAKDDFARNFPEIAEKIPDYVTGPKHEESYMTPEQKEPENWGYNENVEPENLIKQTGPVDTSKVYDMVTLPSKGECYPNKKSSIQVSHLVAYDENLILSPNLYTTGTFLDHILRNKIMDGTNPDNLVPGDRDAIIIWLRAGGYGNEYPVKMVDDETGVEYETTVDLSALKFRKFTLKGDANGYFDYKVPGTGDLIKFKFLTVGDLKKIEAMGKEENRKEKVTTAKTNLHDLKLFFDNIDGINDTEKRRAMKNIEGLEKEFYDLFPESEEDTFYNHELTNRLIMSTVSVNGVTDRKFIVNYIVNMKLKDATDYRRYILDNEPGIDYNVTVQRPESLGGGSVETFLRLSQFIFVR